MSTGRDATQFRQNLTNERRRLRQLHTETRPPNEIRYRGHTIRREPFDRSQSGTYRIIDQDNFSFVDTVEPTDFYHADDFVRYVDLVIQQGRDAAQDWRDEHLNAGWTQ